MAETHSRPAASTATPAEPPKRIKRGYTLREDLIKRLRHIAVDNDRRLYEVIEEALEQYLAACVSNTVTLALDCTDTKEEPEQMSA